MTTFEDMERRKYEMLKLKYERDMDCLSCPKCGSQWFEQCKLSRFKADHTVILGQEIPTRPNSMDYVMLKCAVCNDWLEPRIQAYGPTMTKTDYSHLLDTLEGKHDERPSTEKLLTPMTVGEKM